MEGLFLSLTFPIPCREEPHAGAVKNNDLGLRSIGVVETNHLRGMLDIFQHTFQMIQKYLALCHNTRLIISVF